MEEIKNQTNTTQPTQPAQQTKECKRKSPVDRITPEQFNMSQICSVSATSKDMDTSEGKITVITVEFQYDYRYIDENGVEKPYISDLKVQFPTLKSRKGVSVKAVTKDGIPVLGPDKKPKVKSRISVKFDMSNPAQKSCVSLTPEKEGDEYGAGFFEKLKWALATKLLQIKATLGKLSDRKKPQDFFSVFEQFVYFKKGSDGEYPEGAPLDVHFELNAWGLAGTPERNETPFNTGKMVDGKLKTITIPWEILTNSTVEFKPLVAFNKITIVGTKMYLKFKILSAIVINYEKNKEETLQDDLLLEMINSNPEMATSIEAKMLQQMKLKPDMPLPMAEVEIIDEKTITISSTKTSRESSKPPKNLGKSPPKIEEFVSEDEDESNIQNKAESDDDEDEDDEEVKAQLIELERKKKLAEKRRKEKEKEKA